MCCEHAQELNLPPAVIEMLARYRDLQRRHGWDWGEENLPDYFPDVAAGTAPEWRKESYDRILASLR